MQFSKSTFFVSVVWLVLAWVIYVLIEAQLNPNKLEKLGNTNQVVLKRSSDGHYRTEALINGHKINVLVDTGATGVAISQAIANELGLTSQLASRTSTANGETVSYLTRLNSIKIGGVEAQNVSAMITPGLNGDVLLGMSFLGRMDVRLYHGEMTIKQLE